MSLNVTCPGKCGLIFFKRFILPPLVWPVIYIFYIFLRLQKVRSKGLGNVPGPSVASVPPAGGRSLLLFHVEHTVRDTD